MPNRLAISIAASLAVVWMGCSVVGTGTRTVIKAPNASPEVAALLPGYAVAAADSSTSRVAVFKDNIEPQRSGWLRGDPARVLDRFDGYLQTKYGASNPPTALLSAEVRDLGQVPAFSPTLQAMASAEVLKIMIEPKTSTAEKLARKDLLLNSFLNVGQSFEIKTLNRAVEGCELFYYYPHVEVDLSADVLSPLPTDRFSQLFFMIRLDQDSVGKGVRFVNFLPKDTDIVEFTRGMLKESTTAQAKGTYGLTQSGKATTVVTDKLTTENSVSPALGGEVSLTYSEGLERDLKEAIERRTTGILEDGRTFLADLRSLRQVRIGGSYRFDLLLEVPATIMNGGGTLCVSEPVRNIVNGNVIMLGVVRHVEDVGHTGVIQRVPEAENDDVFEQAVLREVPDRTLWKFSGIPAVRRAMVEEPQGRARRSARH